MVYKFDKKELFKYASITIISILLGLVCFVIYPTTIERSVDLSNTNIKIYTKKKGPVNKKVDLSGQT